MKERIIPHNIEAEQSVLGSMFLSKYAAQKCVENLDKDLFYSDNHKKIFEVMSDLLEKQVPIDFTTVSAELDKRKSGLKAKKRSLFLRTKPMGMGC